MCHLCPHVNKFCCGYSLRSGVLGIGWAYLTLTVLITIASITVIIVLSDSNILENCRERCKKKEGLKFDKCVDKCQKDLKPGTKTVKYCIAVVVVMSILSVLLLVGVYKVVPVLLVVFVYGLPTTYLVNNVVSLTVLGTEGTSAGGLVSAVGMILINWALIAYVCIVVYSLYRTMVNPEEYPTVVDGAVVVVVYARPPNYPQQGGEGPNNPGMPPLTPQADSSGEPKSQQQGYRRG